jgi:hypothetical protein
VIHATAPSNGADRAVFSHDRPLVYPRIRASQRRLVIRIGMQGSIVQGRFAGGLVRHNMSAKWQAASRSARASENQRGRLIAQRRD